MISVYETPGASCHGNILLRSADLVTDAVLRVKEIMPWDLKANLSAQAGAGVLILDVREPAQFAQAHIPGSINVPRGVLEGACD